MDVFCGRRSFSGPDHRHPDEHEERPEHEEANVPRHRSSEVVANVVDAEDLVVDNPFHEVEDTPANEQQAKVAPPRRREAATLPSVHGCQRADQQKYPGRGVEEPVGECVVLESLHGVHREIAALIRKQVVPLKNLMEHDAVDEPSKTDSHQECRYRRGLRRCRI